jgi:hypothetical protein
VYDTSHNLVKSQIKVTGVLLVYLSADMSAVIDEAQNKMLMSAYPASFVVRVCLLLSILQNPVSSLLFLLLGDFPLAFAGGLGHRLGDGWTEKWGRCLLRVSCSFPALQ